MPDYIGSTAADLLGGATSATGAASGADETRTTTTQASQKTRAEINDVTDMLTRRFTTLAEQLNSQINTFTTTVAGSNWQGKAKQQADTLAANLRTQLAQLVARTNQRIEEFKTWMVASADGFNHDVETTLGTMLTDYQNRYSEMSTVLTDFTAQMDQVDSSGGARFAG